MKRYLKLIILFLGLGFSPDSHAIGSENAGGGAGVICHWNPFKKTVHLADTYRSAFEGKEGGILFRRLNHTSKEKIREVFLKTVAETDPGFAQALRHSVLEGGLRFVENRNLPETRDDFVEPGVLCDRVQVGYQHLDSGVVEVHPDYRAAMSPAEDVLFEFHEACVQKTPYTGDTRACQVKIREVIASGEMLKHLQDGVGSLIQRHHYIVAKACGVYMSVVGNCTAGVFRRSSPFNVFNGVSLGSRDRVRTEFAQTLSRVIALDGLYLDMEDILSALYQFDAAANGMDSAINEMAKKTSRIDL